MSLTQKTISAGIIRVISLLFRGIMQLIVIIIFARYLSKEDFGIISIVTSILVFINIFSEIGIGPALIQRKDLSIKHIQVANITMFAIALISYLILFSTADILAYVFKEQILGSVLQVTGIGIIFTCIGNVSYSLLRRDLDFKSLLFIEISSFILSYGLFGISLIMMDYGIWSYIYSSVLQSFLIALMLIIKKPIKGGFAYHKKEFSELFGFAGWLTLENILNTFGRQADVFITGRLLGISTLGLYSRAYQIIDIPNQYIGLALDNVLFPAMSKKQDKLEAVTNAFLKGITITNIMMIPLASFTFVNAQSIIVILFGPNWTEATISLQLLCIMLPFKTSVKIVDSLVRARGASKESSFVKFIFMSLMIVMCLIGVKWGLVGVCLGVNLAVILHFLLMIILAKNLVEFSFIKLLKGFEPGIVCGLIVFVWNFFLIELFSYYDIAHIIKFMFCLFSTTFLGLTSFIFPRILGKTWIWLLYNFTDMIPNKKSFMFLKSFLLYRLR